MVLSSDKILSLKMSMTMCVSWERVLIFWEVAGPIVGVLLVVLLHVEILLAKTLKHESDDGKEKLSAVPRQEF